MGQPSRKAGMSGPQEAAFHLQSEGVLQARLGAATREVLSKREEVSKRVDAQAKDKFSPLDSTRVDDRISFSPSELTFSGSPFVYCASGQPAGEVVEIYKRVQQYFANYKAQEGGPAGEDDSFEPDVFFKMMPKSADTHAHLTGTVSFPKIKEFLHENKLYLHPETFDCKKQGDSDKEGYLPCDEVLRNRVLHDKLRASLTMKGQHPQGLKDINRFFDVCRVGEGILKHIQMHEMVVSIAKNNLSEHLLYQELMVELKFPETLRSRFRIEVVTDEDFTIKNLNKYLYNSDFKGYLKEYVSACKGKLDLCDKWGQRELQSTVPLTSVQSPCCIRFIKEIDRAVPLAEFFIQAVCACELASGDSRVVGVNVVGREDHADSIAHYDDQIEILKWLLDLDEYRGVNLSLHTGEFSHREVDLSKGCETIKKVIKDLRVKRIGHGFAIQDLNAESKREINEMAKQKEITFEACPSSSLEFFGRINPLLDSEHYHLFPMTTINGDDLGIFGSTLSEQYLETWRKGRKGVDASGRTIKHTYRRFMQWNRNGLESAFLKGESLYVKDPNTGHYLIKEKFHGMQLDQSLLDTSEKAYLQLRFEQEVMQFERQFCLEQRAKEAVSPISPPVQEVPVPNGKK